ncbi:PfkB family carbohydrate kinase [candidate division KSB1 bacterium]
MTAVIGGPAVLITGIGEILWDLYPGGKYLGGAIANCIHHVRQLGHEGIVVSRLGDDVPGKEIVNVLEDRKYTTDFLQIDPVHETGWVKITLSDKGEPSFICNETAAYDYLEWDSRFAEIIPLTDAILFGTFAQRTAQSAEVTQRFLRACTGSLKVFDLNIRAWNETAHAAIRTCLILADVVKFNDKEYERLRELYPVLPADPVQGLAAVVKLGDLRLACFTAGEWGCLISDGNKTVYTPGFSVDAVDMTGAGDAFVAALTIDYLQGRPIEHLGFYANLVSALTVTMLGATPGYTEDMLRRFEKRHSHRSAWKEWEGLIA